MKVLEHSGVQSKTVKQMAEQEAHVSKLHRYVEKLKESETNWKAKLNAADVHHGEAHLDM